MSLSLEDPVAASEETAVGARQRGFADVLVSRVRSIWSLPIWVHAVTLAVVLLGLLPIVGTHGIVNSDEGAAIIQAQQLERGDGWITPYAFSSIDPKQSAFPLDHADTGNGGFAAYGKHPLYPLLLAAVDRVGGVTGMFMLSVLGTAVAAFFAALIATRFSPAVARPSVWFVGLGSPLLFDSYQVIAHTLAAAAIAIAVWAALRFLDRGRVATLMVALGAAIVAVALRTESVLLVGAIGMILAVVALMRRDLRAAVGAACLLFTGGVTKVVEQRIATALLGVPAGVAARSANDSLGYWHDRLEAFRTTFFKATYYSAWSGTRIVGLIAVLSLVCAVVVRFRARQSRIIVVLAMTIGVLSLALLVQPPNLIPGLFLASPVLLTGVVLIDRSVLREQTQQVLLGVTLLFFLGVLATQYRFAGGVEWGGRYFALAIPLLCPVVLWALMTAGSAIEARTRPVIVVAMIVMIGSISVLGVRTLRDQHDRAERIFGALRVVSGATSAGDGGSPVVVTDDPLTARFSWSFSTSRRMMWPPTNPARYIGRLLDTGVREFVYVSRNPDVQFSRLSADYRVARIGYLGGSRRWRFAVLRAR